MTQVNFNNRRSPFGLDPFFTELFPALNGQFKRSGNGLGSAIPVNIKKSETGYALEVMAPGFAKEDFKVDLEKNLLTLSAQKADAVDNEKDSYVRREFQVASFKRSFTLDESIDAEAISAQYVNGVLILNLPKKTDVKPQTKQIEIQ